MKTLTISKTAFHDGDIIIKKYDRNLFEDINSASKHLILLKLHYIKLIMVFKS